MKNLIMLACIALLVSCSEEKKLLRKASNAVDRSDFDQAISYYDQIIQKNDNSFFGNAGKGIVLSEFQARHEQAIPYLEKALANSPDKSKPIIHGDLAKSYHFIGNYKRALEYYGKINNDPKYSDFDEFLSKRIADCKYAIDHPEVATEENQNVRNVGNVINTDKPEYTPVYSNGTMYFTSKRQDDPKEKKNGIDGKYFESIYTSKLENGTWSTPQKFELPKGFHMRKFGEAVASITPDGQKLYIYKAGKIYETDVNNTDHMKELDKNVNSTGLMNHAALSPDGNTMYFTSESSNGDGGSDIYVTTKNSDGTWADPKALDNMINTAYDEEAPFITADGVLYFASNGHPGYGGFDIYSSKQVNGVWSKPENLGQPINSPGDDIFFTLLNNTSNGYYASARPGGFGDLDIYHVHYMRNETGECAPTEKLAIVATPELNNAMAYNVKLDIPDEMKSHIRSYRWQVNGQPLGETGESFHHTFTQPDNYRINARVVTYCDTCPTLQAFCAEKNITIQSNILAANDATANANSGNTKGSKGKKGKNVKGGNESEAENNAVASNTTSGKSKSTNGKMKGNNDADNNNGDATGTESDNGMAAANGKNSGKGASRNGTASQNGNSGTTASTASTGDMSDNFMSEQRLKELNWNTGTMLFDLNDASVRSESQKVLDDNIKVLKQHSGLKVVISGYTDSRGSAAYNKALSVKRAGAVKKYMVSNGVPAKQIKATKGYGETQLVNNCSDGVDCSESEHQQNRRVKVDVIDGASTITQN